MVLRLAEPAYRADLDGEGLVLAAAAAVLATTVRLAMLRLRAGGDIPTADASGFLAGLIAASWSDCSVR